MKVVKIYINRNVEISLQASDKDAATLANVCEGNNLEYSVVDVTPPEKSGE